MNTAYPQKLADISLALVTTPQVWLPYATHLPFWGRQPADVELPWFSFKAIQFLRRYIKPHHRVFEFGSGGSTFFFARHAASVLSMESHAEWHGRVEELARERRVANLRCELYPLTEGHLDGYRQSPFFQRVLADEWDIISIDCFCGFSDGSYGQLRRHAFELSLTQTRPGGLIILDDSWLFPELIQPRAGWTLRDYVGLGPCRYGVTSTAILQRDEA